MTGGDSADAPQPILAAASVDGHAVGVGGTADPGRALDGWGISRRRLLWDVGLLPFEVDELPLDGQVNTLTPELQRDYLGFILIKDR